MRSYPWPPALLEGRVPRELTPESIAAAWSTDRSVPTVNSTVHFYPINGAFHDVSSDATAFGHRDANFALVIAGMWPDPAENEANTQWVKDYDAAIAPFSQGGGYINSPLADDQSKVARTTAPTTSGCAGSSAVRPGQPVPPQPEHRAVVGGREPSTPRANSCGKRRATGTHQHTNQLMIAGSRFNPAPAAERKPG